MRSRLWVPLLTMVGVSCSLPLFTQTPAPTRGHSGGSAAHSRPSAARDDAAAAAAFESMTAVLHHPRCMNCHSKGDYPRQGDDSHPHSLDVRRGPTGNGVAGLNCSTCHEDHNSPEPDAPPGAPGWHKPSPKMPMTWDGLSDKQLCELFKDPSRNGHRSVAQIVGHMQTPLVLWGWHPGPGRTPIPVPQAKFLADVKEWAAKGAACPLAGH